MKVLHIVDHMLLGGIQTFIMTLYRNVDRNNLHFDFLLFRNSESIYTDEIRKLGGNIYYCPARHDGILKNLRSLDHFFMIHHDYDAIHYHISSLTDIEPLYYAKKYGIQKRIVHSHSSSIKGNPAHYFLHYMNKFRLFKLATHYVACGETAAKWLYGMTPAYNKRKIIYNGISVSDYTYNEGLRNKYREYLEYDKSTFCIIHVGRFSLVKNHKYLLEVFVHVLKYEPNARLLLVGNGELMKEITSEVSNLKIQDKVVFLGFRSDIPSLLQAADSFVLPSLYEGFPISVIEAEAAGLPVVLSDTITREVELKPNIKYLSLKEKPEVWARTIIENKKRAIDNKILFDRNLDLESLTETIYCLYKD